MQTSRSSPTVLQIKQNVEDYQSSHGTHEADEQAAMPEQSITHAAGQVRTQTSQDQTTKNSTSTSWYGMTEQQKQHYLSCTTLCSKLTAAVDQCHWSQHHLQDLKLCKDNGSKEEIPGVEKDIASATSEIRELKRKLHNWHLEGQSTPKIAVPTDYGGAVEPKGALVRWFAIEQRPTRWQYRDEKRVAEMPFDKCTEAECPMGTSLSLLSSEW